MKAKIKSGHQILSFNKWDKIADTMIINFANKNTYKSFQQKKNHLLIDTTDGTVDIVFCSEVPTLAFKTFDKDQLILKAKKHETSRTHTEN